MANYQAPKHVVVPYVENTLYSTNKYSCVRPVHTLYMSYFIEYNGDDEPHDYVENWNKQFFFSNATTCPPPTQCHHMSLWTSCSSLLGMAGV